MQALSRVLMRLYEAAEHVSMKAFPDEALRLLRPLIACDGGALGIGMTRADGSDAGLTIDDAYIYQRDPVILPEYALLSPHDPVAARLARGLAAPLACCCADFYRAHRLPELQAFCRRHALAQLLLFGEPAMPPCRAQWLVLYRSDDQRFSAQEAHYLMALWPHLRQALSINRRRFLDAQLVLQEKRVAALVNPRGVIEAAHPRFWDLLQREWPGFCGNRLPDALLRCCRQGRAYVGARIRVALRVQEDVLVCIATRLHLPRQLTHAERLVASQFASGHNHRQVAHDLGMSHHTVRSHLAHIYAKLDVHDKAALANRLAAEAAGPDDDE